MEEMGIIRRVDALGRIVIPREFRKLNRIEVGDPVEMRAMADGEIVIRKVDMSAQLKSIGAIALESLALHTDKAMGVCSPEKWLEFSGRNPFATDELPDAVASAVKQTKSSVIECKPQDGEAVAKYMGVYPVCGDAGAYGAIVVFSDVAPTASEKALFETVVAFAGKGLMRKF